MKENTVTELHTETEDPDDFGADIDDIGEENPIEQSRLDQLLEHDRRALVEDCRTAIISLNNFADDRSATSADMNSIRKQLYAKGISKDALKAALCVSKLKDDDLDGFDLSLSVLREAIGKPVDVAQMRLFER